MALGAWTEYSVRAISDWEMELSNTEPKEEEHDETILNWLEGK